ncbi:latent-transforming growth factor beta-binding protein 4 [Plasmodium fragile]|uniref:Latent-transforming growth factor beta-binding protein 4 n=1 Tax=Plasmodium fragile TaxID=5857 RepID=A0A0D9QRV2_PLAFR|nr:latent-transforming growth factor beta-binding protein 4 [Plasmodium fragile]KJP88406.1 latent-transforming growth factor beta-binding protein 4 [Plasmodium fragile]
MEDEDLDIYAANCLNVGYPSRTWKGVKVVAKVGDRMMCTLMSRALVFMNRWRPGSASAEETDPMNEPLKEHIRCAIVNIFMHILLASPCRSQMGIDYAWDIVHELEEYSSGLLRKGKCSQGVFADIHIKDFHMQKMIKAWLQNNGTIQGTIGGNAMKSKCTKKIEELVGATRDAHAMDAKIPLHTHEKDVIKQLGTDIKLLVRKVQQEVMQCAQENGACMKSIEPVSSSDVDDDDSKAIVSNSVASATPAQSGKVDREESPTSATSGPSEKETSNQNGDHSHHKKEDKKDATSNEDRKIQQTPPPTTGAVAGATELGRADTTAGGGEASQPQAPASPVLPARPPPPPPPRRPSTPRHGPQGEVGIAAGGPGSVRDPPPVKGTGRGPILQTRTPSRPNLTPPQQPPTTEPPPGNGGSNRAKPVAATPVQTNTGKTGIGHDCAWTSMLEETKSKVHVLGYYSAQQLEKMKNVLQQFVVYMDKNDEYMDALGANCANKGWNDMDDNYRSQQTVGDMMRCRLMTLALFFANGDNIPGKTAEGTSIPVDSTEEALRSEVANAFGYILERKFCEYKTQWKRGIKYAWKTVKAMGGDGGIGTTGPVIQQRCTECGYNIQNPVVRVVDGEMVQLLIHEGNLMGRIAEMERQQECSKDWQAYKREKEADKKSGKVNKIQFPEVEKQEQEIIKITKEAVEKVKEKIDQEIANGRDTSTHGNNTTSVKRPPYNCRVCDDDGSGSGGHCVDEVCGDDDCS